MATASQMQGFFLTELLEFATRELGGGALERACRDAKDVLALPLDPTRPCTPEAFHEVAGCLAAAAGEPVDAWLRRFGAALFGHLAVLHAVFFIGVGSVFDFLAGFERGVLDEIRALAPGLDPPRMEATRLAADRLRLTYRSERRLAALAHGMLEGCLAHFGERGVVRAEVDPQGAVSFLIERVGPGVAGVADRRVL